MDTLTASALVLRQDSYAVPPNYIGPPGRCQRIDDGQTQRINLAVRVLPRSRDIPAILKYVYRGRTATASPQSPAKS
jgi:hypothetical protein